MGGGDVELGSRGMGNGGCRSFEWGDRIVGGDGVDLRGSESGNGRLGLAAWERGKEEGCWRGP